MYPIFLTLTMYRAVGGAVAVPINYFGVLLKNSHSKTLLNFGCRGWPTLG